MKHYWLQLFMVLLLNNNVSVHGQQDHFETRSSSLPTVQLVDEYIQSERDAYSPMHIKLELLGPGTPDPVTAFLTVTDHNDTVLQPLLSATWAPTEVGIKEVSFNVPGTAFSNIDNVILVQLLSAVNATINDRATTTTITSQATPNSDDGTPAATMSRFQFHANTVAYPGQKPTITITRSFSEQPATLKYKLISLPLVVLPTTSTSSSMMHESQMNTASTSNPTTSTTADVDSFLPSSFIAGFLHFNPQDTQRAITIPIEWHRVPEYAEYRLGLQLEGFYNAWILDQKDDVAVHVFGVHPGTCPPGTAVAKRQEADIPGFASTVGESKSNVAREEGANMVVYPIDLNTNSTVMVWVAVNGTAIPLSVRTLDEERNSFAASTAHTVRSDDSSSSTLVADIGGMVDERIKQATLCIVVNNNGSMIGGGKIGGDSAVILNSSKSNGANDTTNSRCCSSSNNHVADSLEIQVRTNLSRSDGRSPESTLQSLIAENNHGEELDALCGIGNNAQRAWHVDLVSGTNQFSIGTNMTSPSMLLSIVQLANQSHTMLDLLSINGLDGSSMLACGSGSITATTMTAPAPTSAINESSSQDQHSASTQRCMPGVSMSVSVPASTETVSVVPHLLHPEVNGVRVEINGQVLSRGGDLSADRALDTSSSLQYSSNSTFLPAAYVVGMQPDVTVNIDIIIIAEDGVTSSLYPLKLTRSSSSHQSAGDEVTSSVSYAPSQQTAGWPLPPSLLSTCAICPPGWMSGAINSASCELCPPGTAAPTAQSRECAPCDAGTYSLSWGSSHCKHCIAGTYSPSSSQSTCQMCPEGTTTVGDGRSACNVTLSPATNLDKRYAVLVYFSVFLTGSDPDSIILKAGVNAPVESIVGSLLRSDTAAAFNISMEDVHVLSLHHVARRVLQANMSATLGVDLPSDATEEEIAAALQVQKLSADEPIQLLSQDPDSFFGRTTKTLDVGVDPILTGTEENRPRGGPAVSRWALIAPGICGAVTGVILLAMGFVKGGSTKMRQWQPFYHGQGDGKHRQHILF